MTADGRKVVRRQINVLQSILDGISDGIIVADENGRLLYANPAVERITGHDINGHDLAQRARLLGFHHADQETPFQPEELPLDRAVRGETVNDVDIYVRNDRRPRGIWISASARPFQDAEGRSLGGLVIFRDITARKRSEISLRASEERLRSQTQTALDAIVTADARGDIVSWNTGAARMFGYAEEEALGRALTLLIPERLRKAHQDGLEHVRRTGESRLGPRVIESFGLRKDGSEFPIELALTSWTAGPERYFTAIIRDATERKRLEAELRARADELARSNEDLRLFASMVSHELQDPARKIVGFGGMIVEKCEESGCDKAQYVRKMHDFAGRMQPLVNAILDLARLTAHSGRLEPVDLGALLRELAAEFESLVVQTGGRLDVGALPTVRADLPQMRQLFHNLLSNAFKFRRKDSPPQIAVTSRETGDGFVDISVADNGVGFDEALVGRLFKPFGRLHRKSDYDGSGLGLAICERIALRHSGLITAHSVPGRGSTFTVTLPA